MKNFLADPLLGLDSYKNLLADIKNKKQVIAALLHDIDVPAFLYSSYYIDESNFSKDDIPLTNLEFWNLLGI